MDRLFLAIVGVVALERLVELVVSRRNQRALLSRGGRLVEGDGFGLLVAVHVSWFPAMLVEHQLAPWAGRWSGTWLLLGAYLVAEALRLWAIATLGRRWTTRVVVLEDAALVQEGPYRWLDHPNYVAVAVELAALPLAFGLPATAALAALANGIGLTRRIRVEEAALGRSGGASGPDGA